MTPSSVTLGFLAGASVTDAQLMQALTANLNGNNILNVNITMLLKVTASGTLPVLDEDGDSNDSPVTLVMLFNMSRTLFGVPVQASSDYPSSWRGTLETLNSADGTLARDLDLFDSTVAAVITNVVQPDTELLNKANVVLMRAGDPHVLLDAFGASPSGVPIPTRGAFLSVSNFGQVMSYANHANDVFTLVSSMHCFALHRDCLSFFFAFWLAGPCSCGWWTVGPSL